METLGTMNTNPQTLGVALDPTSCNSPPPPRFSTVISMELLPAAIALGAAVQDENMG